MPDPKTETAAEPKHHKAPEAPAEAAASPAPAPVTAPPPAAEAPKAKAAPPAAMPFLGVLAPPGLRQAKKQVGVAGLPCVVLNAQGVPLGVVVASNPSFLGDALVPKLKEAGLEGPFQQIAPTKLNDAGKMSAARAIMRASDPQLDKAGALAAFGYTAKMLA